MLYNIRSSLLEEARSSPNLLSDLAGLENYISEAYDSRCLMELLQNADDAEAEHFSVIRFGTTLAVANDGRLFTREDLESLCRSAASTKTRGSSIGYRGIGFKSVVGIADRVYLISGGLECVFCRVRTANEIPGAKRVPLLRIPHELTQHEKTEISDTVFRLKEKGLGTSFIFTGLSMRRIEDEISNLDPCTLLFLNHISHFQIRTDVVNSVDLKRHDISTSYQRASLSYDDIKNDWIILRNEGVSLAAIEERPGKINPLEEKDALVHAFLPTQETTGLGVRVNGDFSTEPSRTRVVFDERTSEIIHKLSSLIITKLSSIIDGKDDPSISGLIIALIPNYDPRMFIYQRRSFKTELFASLQKLGQRFFITLKLRPQWLNYVDFEKLAIASNLRFVPRTYESLESLASFLKFLGASEAKLEDLWGALKNTDLTVPGAVELTSRIASLWSTRQIDLKMTDQSWRLWPIKGRMLSLNDAINSGYYLDQDFIDITVEKSGSIESISLMLEQLSNHKTSNQLLKLAMQGNQPMETSIPLSPIQSTRNDPQSVGDHMSIQRWRGAEQQVLAVLQAKGWSREDVSRQNIGYDLEGHNHLGQIVCIEVKSIQYPGQPFTLTSNEEAVARVKGNAYFLAIVHQSNTSLDVALIKNPVNKLKLIRQCRQWVWECSNYLFEPDSFPLA